MRKGQDTRIKITLQTSTVQKIDYVVKQNNKNKPAGAKIFTRSEIIEQAINNTYRDPTDVIMAEMQRLRDQSTTLEKRMLELAAQLKEINRRRQAETLETEPLP